MQEHEKVSKTNIRRWVRGREVRWVPCLLFTVGKDKQLKKSGEAKVREGKVGPCRSLHLDDWIERVGLVLRWGVGLGWV